MNYAMLALSAYAGAQTLAIAYLAHQLKHHKRAHRITATTLTDSVDLLRLSGTTLVELLQQLTAATAAAQDGHIYTIDAAKLVMTMQSIKQFGIRHGLVDEEAPTFVTDMFPEDKP